MTDPIELFLSRLQHPVMAGIDLKLDRMQRLLSLLGNPHKRLPPVLHVAGTNGKGSLIAYLRAIFEAAGLRVHVYTSPHLAQFRERIVIAGKMIENAHLESLAHHVARILPQQPATYFEAATAFAFLAFAEKPADILLLETGLGGRLDATNVIDKPLLTAITPVSFDHTEFLGNTLAKIAGEKAGILKKEVPCVIGRQEPEAADAIAARASELNAPLFRLGQEWKVENHHYISPTKNLLLTPALVGEHQFDNAGTAVACIERMPQFSITDEQIANGLARANWPGRLQNIPSGGYKNILPKGMELWLDGGHNPQGGEVLAAWIAEQKKPTYLVCGMVGTKDADGYMKAIAPQVKGLWAITIPGEATSKKAPEVAASAAKAGIAAHTAPSIEAALAEIAKTAPESALVVIAGSLYLAGFVLQQN